MKIISKIILLCLLVVSEHYGQHCGASQEPTPPAYANNMRLSAEQLLNGRNQPNEISIKLHIIRRSNGTGGIAFEDVLDGLERANNLYVPQANIRFKICPDVDFIDDDNVYNNFVDSIVEVDIFAPREVSYAVDVFYAPQTNSGGFSWAHFPWSSGDRIVMLNGHAPTNVLAHELGHYFGLRHTHYQTEFLNDGIPNNHNINLVESVDGVGCNIRGDEICDTPADPFLSGRVNSNCVYTGTVLDQNGDPYVPDAFNVMSYTQDHCRTNFSTQQVLRILWYLQNDRPGIWGNRNKSCPCENEPTNIILSNESEYTGCKEELWWWAPIEYTTSISANQNILAFNEVTNTANVTFNAGQTIRLEPGFSVALGGQFRTQNQTCTPHCSSGLRTVNNAVRELPNSQNSATLNTNTTTLAEAPTKLACFPNPANTSLNIRFQAAAGDEAYLHLVTIQGQTVLQLKESNLSEGKQVYQLSTTDLPAGVYFLNLTTKQGTETARVVIQH